MAKIYLKRDKDRIGCKNIDGVKCFYYDKICTSIDCNRPYPHVYIEVKRGN